MWKNEENRKLQERARRVIPGGMYGHESTKLLPPDYPQFFVKAEGARMWDADGNEYIDFMCAYGPNLLGYCHPDVDAAAARQQALGDTVTGPSPLLIDLAEDLVGMVSHADWAMFTKNGTDSTSACLTVARAATGKRKILVAKGAYHGAGFWCTPVDKGITPEDRAHLIYFTFNDVESLSRALAEAGDDLAGIMVAAFKHDAFTDQAMPEADFARAVRQACDDRDVPLIVDDVRAGFRLAVDCSWSVVGVEPDLAAWGKALANGHPISAITGNDRYRAAAEGIYVTGSFWFGAVPMAAAIETLRHIRDGAVVRHIEKIGGLLRDGWAEQGGRHGVAIRQTGPVQMPLVLFEDDPDLAKGNRWCTEALKRGVYLHPWHNMFVCAAHSEADVARTLEATDAAFAAVASMKKGRAAE